MFKLLSKLTAAFGVSGNEEEIREVILGEIKDKVDDVYTDIMGNLIAVKKGKGKKIMIDAHMDEIGIMAIYIDEKGFIRFANIGWVSQYYSLCQRVRFKNGTIGSIFYEEKLEEMKNLKLSNLYIDIGAKNKEEAQKKVKIGDTACFTGETVKNGDMVISKALDDRSGCAVLIKTIQEMPKTDNELYFVFSVQEELGLRGAKTAAYSIKPDFAIGVDVTLSGDTPESILRSMRCGDGPCIKIKDGSIICHPDIKNLLVSTAEKNKIPYQFEVLESGGNNTGAIQLTAGGIPSGVISIACRYVHSPIEMLSLTDLENAAKLLKYSIL